MKLKTRVYVKGAYHDVEFEGQPNEIDMLEEASEKLKSAVKKLVE